jgi:hypothetical protein
VPAAGVTVLALREPASGSTIDPRHARVVRTAADGRYEFFALPAGQYWLAALDDVSAPGWQETRRLNAIRALGTRITVKDEETRAVDLRVLPRR